MERHPGDRPRPAPPGSPERRAGDRYAGREGDEGIRRAPEPRRALRGALPQGAARRGVKLKIRGGKKTTPRTRARKEPAPERRIRARKILGGLKTLYPDADCALCHQGPLELLVATILSAQCTDATVNKVTPALFKRYPTARDFAEADPAKIE